MGREIPRTLWPPGKRLGTVFLSRWRAGRLDLFGGVLRDVLEGGGGEGISGIGACHRSYAGWAVGKSGRYLG